MTAIEEVVCYRSVEKEANPQREGHSGKHQLVRRHREMKKCGHKPSLWFLWMGTDKAGHTGLGLVNVNNCSGLWGAEAVLS